ncbi:MAG: hypothetical protein JRL30_25205 [Deltaproteobacteria bacterium]|nr:hypothetical protein [Deltaproteobacteria bacterium]
MAQETKIVKGGFRATLALIISIIAIILSFIAFTSTAREDELNARIKDLRASMERIRDESSKQMDKLRDETANTLERLSKTVKKQDETKQ